MSIPRQSIASWRAENPYATFLFGSTAQARISMRRNNTPHDGDIRALR
jgi:hypothetical protein